jgi:DNA-binding GntR family transcriptional regulator
MQAIRDLLLRGVLLPGEHIRQVQLAQDLGVSRIPVREALAKLAEERVLVHTPDVGYRVARFDISDLKQIYLMREVLETELLKATGGRLSDETVEELIFHTDQMHVADEETDITAFTQHNRQFHFAIFDAAGLELVRAEVGRLWNMVGSYHPLYIYDKESRRRVIDEHRQFIEAIKNGDLESLIATANAHRDSAVAKLSEVLHVRSAH